MMSKRLIAIGLIVILSAVLAFLMADFFRDNIILPIAQFLNGIIWIIQSFIESIDQVIFWVSFLIIALIIASASLLNPTRLHPPDNRLTHKHKSRIAVWQERIDNLHRGDYFKWRLAKNLGGLAIEVIAFRYGIGIEQAMAHLIEHDLDLPDDIRAYIIAGQRSSPFKTDSLNMGGRNRSDHSTPLDLDPKTLLEFLDTRLGNDHIAGDKI